MTTQLQETGAVYALDPAHTTVEFVVRHLMITKVRGRFTAFDGSVELEPGREVRAGQQIYTVPMSSVTRICVRPTSSTWRNSRRWS